MPLIDSSTKLLLHGEELLDSSPHKVPLTNQGAVISADQSRFGGKSLYFNGSSRVEIPSNAITFGSGDFTIDWWEYCTTGNSGTRFSSCYMYDKNLYGGLMIGYRSNNVYISSRTNAWDIVNGTVMLSVSPNEWVHWAFVRKGTIIKSYRNGKLFQQTDCTGAIMAHPGTPMAIGDYDTGDPAPFTGYIDEFRIVQAAVWTADFTPPSEPYFILGDVATIRLLPLLLKAWDEVHIEWSEATGKGVTYILERSINGGAFTEVYRGNGLSFTEPAQTGWQTVRYRVKSAIGETQGKYQTSAQAKIYRLSDYTGKVLGGGI